MIGTARRCGLAAAGDLCYHGALWGCRRGRRLLKADLDHDR
jgi:hypothetical protein